MQETAKQIISYWYSLDALNPRLVSDYDKPEKNKPKPFYIKKDNICLYQQTAIDFSLVGSESYYKTVSELVMPIPNKPYSQSLVNYLKYFEGYYKKYYANCVNTYTVDLSCAVFTCVVDGTTVLERFIDKLHIDDVPETPTLANLYCASFTTDNDGYYEADSVRLSPFIWAVRELILHPDTPLQNLHLHQWSEVEKDIERKLQEAGRSLSIDAAVNVINKYLCEQILSTIGVEIKRPGDVYTYCGLTPDLVKAKTGNNKRFRHQLKASHFLFDLYYLLKELNDMDEDNKLMTYINSLNTTIEQYDLLRDTKQLKAWCQPSALPLGRWPSQFNLSLMQQVAVNIAKENPKEIFSVNGPPGTGKTTLLKDIVANNIVERAVKICEYDHVEDLFSKVESTDGTQCCYEIPSAISKYGMLVLSANNKAVENITLELPNISSVKVGANESHLFDPQYSELHVDVSLLKQNDDEPLSTNEIYFTFLANLLSQSNNQWGLISTRLGNSSNISDFKPVLEAFTKRLEPIFQVESAQDLFADAKKKFKKQYALVTQLFKYVETYEANLKRLTELDNKVSLLEVDLKKLELKISNVDSMNESIQALMKEKSSIEDELIELNQKQSFFGKVLGSIELPILKSFSKPSLLFRIVEKQKALEDIHAELTKVVEELAIKKNLIMERGHMKEESDQLVNEVEYILKEQESINSILNIAKGNSISCFDTIESIYGISREEDEELYKSVHTSYLYICDYLNECREQLFFDALQVQKAVAISKPFRDNMKLLSDYWGSFKKRQELDSAFGLDQVFPLLFNTLFLAVPVISSTFASVETMLRNCRGEGSLGTIIVDEAGQAAPHMVVGALYRAQQAIIVGDPKQIEPVQPVQDLFVKYVGNHDIDQYRHKSLSVQRLADALNPYAGTIREQDDSISWIGCPLVVHRRCGDIMFNISNDLSYGGFMINETISKKNSCLPSCWITYDATNIMPLDKKNHYVKKQGEIAFTLIKHLLAHQVEFEDIFVITPFKTVAEGFRFYVKHQLYELEEVRRKSWLDNNIGTVHTFQGKEARVVIYMLGCVSNGVDDGAIRWVNTNNVNVAFTRAKEQIYVIGDDKKWRTLNDNFNFVLSNNRLPLNTEFYKHIDL